jgi:glucose-1-phosphate thymidylyltransferase
MNLNKISIVILAGGLGTRLKDFRGTNTEKVLLEINGIPMITKQIEQVINWGFNLQNIVCVTNPNIDDSIQKVNKDKFGSGIKYVIQPKPLGIAHAFSYAEDKISSEHVLLVLGDNFFENNPFQNKENISEGISNIFIKSVENPEDFGVAEVKGGRIISLEEKPENPKSHLAVVGLYLYKSDIFSKIKSLKPSERGELEITDLNIKLIEEGGISYHEIDGWWIDAGTPERITELESKTD